MGFLALLLPAAALLSAEPLTFFAFSDIHFGQSSVLKDAHRAAMVGRLNALPGKAYPDWVGGGPVAEPRGVLVAGDLVDYADPGLWVLYQADYGIRGESRLRFPIYDGMGNHEFYGTAFETLVAALKRRHADRRADSTLGIAGMDESGLHYSWDWEGVHFVNLNVFAGGAAPLRAGVPGPNGSLDFLRRDLAERVGTSGRPVLLMQHFPFLESDTWFPASERNALISLLTNYNCIGILHGHTHARRFYKYRGLDIFDDGAGMYGDHLVFRIQDGKLLVLNRVGDAWGGLRFEKAISMSGPWKKTPEPQPRPEPNPDAAAPLPKRFRLDVAGMGTVYRAEAEIRRVEIRNHEGRLVRILVPAGGLAHWDRLDESGKPVQRGLYVACAARAGSGRPVVLAKLAL